jgi:putative tryptophan/tyrosine transport system substrate-binding protein
VGRNSFAYALIVALTLGIGLLPVEAAAQQAAAKVWRIGFLGAVSPAANKERLDAFKQALQDLGYVEGRNIVIEYRWAEGDYSRLAKLAKELATRKPDLIVSTGGRPSMMAIREATTSIPVVFIGAEPVAAGLVLSLARPGGNFTGLDVFSVELDTKRLALLKEAFPKISHVVLLWNPDNPSGLTQRYRVETAAQALGVRVQLVEARRPEQLDGAFASMTRQRADALLVTADPMYDSQRHRIVELAKNMRLPTIYQWREFTDIGGLMSYGTDLTALYRRLPVYIDRIFKGAKPAEIAVEQPTKYEFVINLKSAQAMGLTVSPAALARADHLIQ